MPLAGGASQWAGLLGIVLEVSLGLSCTTHPNLHGKVVHTGAVGITCCKLLPGLLPITKVCAVDPLALGQLANIGSLS